MNPEKNTNPYDDFATSDYSDAPFYNLLIQLPPELAKRHLRYIESEHMTDGEASEYLEEKVRNRRESLTHSAISDPGLSESFKGHEQNIFTALETSVFYNPDNYLGTGMTAKVKHYTLVINDNPLQLAIKYVVTPTEKTLTAEQEHNAIKEVERMQIVETAELEHPRRSKYIRVPHPYLYHNTDKIHLYGMEMIDGITLEQANTQGMLPSSLRDAIRQSPIAKLPQQELDGYIERFFDTMHEFCLHGDVKPKNIMIGRNGVIYIIDFGQSVAVHNVPTGAEDQLENLKLDETKQTQQIVKMTLQKILQD